MKAPAGIEQGESSDCQWRVKASAGIEQGESSGCEWRVKAQVQLRAR